MLSIVPETHEMARQIHGVYDLDLIKQQIDVGSFDVAAILMATLGAPVAPCRAVQRSGNSRSYASSLVWPEAVKAMITRTDPTGGWKGRTPIPVSDSVSQSTRSRNASADRC